MHALFYPIGYPMALLLLLVALPVQAILLLLTAPFDKNRTVPGRFLRIVGVLITFCFPPWRLSLKGRWPSGGPFVVVANHQSMLDILFLSRVPREMKWVAKQALFETPWIGWLLKMSGDIPVKRGDAESGGEALEQARTYLERGMNVMMFPEGTRSKTRNMLPFKSGAFRLAIEAGVPVLPIAVFGTARGMPKGGLWVNPCRAAARLLEPVATTGLGPGDVNKLRDAVRARIAAVLPELERETGASPLAA